MPGEIERAEIYRESHAIPTIGTSETIILYSPGHDHYTITERVTGGQYDSVIIGPQALKALMDHHNMLATGRALANRPVKA